jgi:hypothetical protein
VERQKRLDALRGGNRSSVAEDVHDGRADPDSLRASEDAVTQLQDVGVQTDLPHEVRDHGVRIRLLHLGRQVALRHPGRAESQSVGQLHLLEEIVEHDLLRRHVAVDFGLGDGEENVEFHARGTLAEARAVIRSEAVGWVGAKDLKVRPQAPDS